MSSACKNKKSGYLEGMGGNGKEKGLAILEEEKVGDGKLKFWKNPYHCSDPPPSPVPPFMDAMDAMECHIHWVHCALFVHGLFKEIVTLCQDRT